MLARVTQRTQVGLSHGRVLDVRMVTAGEVAAIEEAFLPIPVPTKPDPNGGSLSTVPDREHPDYVRRTRTRSSKIMAAEVAAAIDLANESGQTLDVRADEKTRAAWVTWAAETVLGMLSETEIGYLWAASRNLGGIEGVQEQLRKLIVEVNGGGGDGGGGGKLEIPEVYGRTKDALLLRAAARFGQDPFVWLKSLTREQENLILADQIEFETASDRKAASGSGAGA